MAREGKIMMLSGRNYNLDKYYLLGHFLFKTSSGTVATMALDIVQ